MHDATEPHWARTFTVHERVHNDARECAHAHTRASVLALVHTHARETLYYECKARRHEVNPLACPARRSCARLGAVRSTNLNSAPSVALFNGSTDKYTALVHSAVGTRMHASFTRRSALSGPTCASCAPAARGGRAFSAEIIFIIIYYSCYYYGQ